MDDIVIQYLITNHGEEARTRLAFGSTPLLTRSLHFAVRQSLPDAESIISRFAAELRVMIADAAISPTPSRLDSSGRGDIYEGWATVPQQYKAPDFSRPTPNQNTFKTFTFKW